MGYTAEMLSSNGVAGGGEGLPLVWDMAGLTTQRYRWRFVKALVKWDTPAAYDEIELRGELFTNCAPKYRVGSKAPSWRR